MSNDYFDSADYTALQADALARSANVNAIASAIEAGFDKVPAEARLKQNRVTHGTFGGTANVHTCTLTYPITSYTAGLHISYVPTLANTGATTVNVDGVGAVAIKRPDGTALQAGDVVANAALDLRHNGTDFNVIGAPPGLVSAAATSATAAATSATNAATSAAAAASSATAAATAQTAAETAETNAETAQTAAEAARDVLAYKYLFDNSTTMADPGSGDIRFNNATIASITAIAISNTFSGGSDISDFIATWDDSTHSPASVLKVKKSGDADGFIEFNVTAVTDNGAWLQLTVTVSASGGLTISNGDTLYIHNTPSGNDGVVSVSFKTISVSGQLDVVADSATDTLTLAAGANIAITTDATTDTVTVAATGVVVSGGALGTPSSGTLTNCTGLPQAGVTGLTTADSPQFAGVNIGHASDTTVTRTGAGDIAVEGNAIYRAGGTDVPVPDGGTGASTFTDAGVLIGNGTGAVQVTSAGTAGQVLTSNGAGVDPTFQAASGTVTLGTLQATTSGTSFNFGSIPASTKIIVISFRGVGLSGTEDILVQIGDAGGIETSGYVSTSGPDTTSVASSTSGFLIARFNAGDIVSGHMILTLMDAATFLWDSSHAGKYSTAAPLSGGGDKALSDTLTQLTITRTGADTFNAGSVNILYLG